jgi:hypothetical protein
MKPKTELGHVSREIDVFLRGKYVLDELSDGKGQMTYVERHGTTIAIIHRRKKHYEFELFFGAADRERFESQRGTFPEAIQRIYDETKIGDSGFKFLGFPVADRDMFEAVQRVIMIKKAPDRQPFPQEGALYSRCGMRCDLCVHFTGVRRGDAHQLELCERTGRLFGRGIYGEDMMRCPGSINKENHTCGGNALLQADFDGHCGVSTLATDITLAILPYVQGQFGN